jgi:hypothetical protein
LLQSNENLFGFAAIFISESTNASAHKAFTLARRLVGPGLFTPPRSSTTPTVEGNGFELLY